MIRDFIELLDLMYQHPDLQMQSIIDSEEFAYAKSEAISDKAADDFLEFEI